MPPDRCRSRRGLLVSRFAAPVGILVAVAYVFHLPVLTDAQFFFRDAIRLSLPDRLFMWGELRDGRLPLWFPFEGLGVPFVGQLSTGILHPINLVYVVLPFQKAYQLNFVLSSGMAGISTYALARLRGISVAGALTSGLAFALCGPLVTQSNLTYLVSNASIPLALSLFEASARTPKLWRGLVASFGLASLVFSGDPQGALAVLAFMVSDAFAFRGRDRAVRLRLIVAIALGAALVAAVQLLPAIAAFLESPRMLIVSSSHEMWSLRPARLLELFVAGIADPNANDRYSALALGGDYPWMPSIFIGSGVLAFAVAGVRRDRRAATLGIVGIVFLWLSLGPSFGLERMFSRFIPLWSGFRYPEKLLAFFAFAACVLSGSGFDMALSGRANWEIRCSAGIPLASLLGIHIVLASRLGGDWKPVLERATVHLLPAVLTGLGLLLLRRRTFFSRPALAIALTIVPLLLADQQSLKLIPSRDLFAIPWAAEVLLERHGGQAPPRIFSRDPKDKRPRVPNAPSPEESVNYFSRSLLVPDFNAPMGIENFVGYHPFPKESQVRLLSQDAPLLFARLLPTFGVEYIVALDSGTRWPDQWEEIARHSEAGIVILRARRPMSRAYIARSAVSVPTAPEAIRLLCTPSFHPEDTAAIEGPTIPYDSTPRDRGTAEVTRWSPQSVDVEATMDAAGILVLNDAFDSGWRVTADGEPRELIRVNGAVRGLRLEAGKHLVHFWYSPPLFWTGLAITLGTLVLGLLGCAFHDWRGGPRLRPSAGPPQ